MLKKTKTLLLFRHFAALPRDERWTRSVRARQNLAPSLRLRAHGVRPRTRFAPVSLFFAYLPGRRASARIAHNARSLYLSYPSQNSVYALSRFRFSRARTARFSPLLLLCARLETASRTIPDARSNLARSSRVPLRSLFS